MNLAKKLLIFFFGIVVGVMGVYLIMQTGAGKILNPVSETATQLLPKPLEKYSFENLRKTTFSPSKIYLGKKMKEDDKFVSYMFYFCMDKKFVTQRSKSKECPDGGKVSGLMNIPRDAGTHPIIVMFRGFVERSDYSPGVGTSRAGEVFASNGYITLAPDFLGYGQSDPGSTGSIEDRFQTYTTALTLLASLGNLQVALDKTDAVNVRANPEKVGIWGHSNGGHISLSILAITGKKYPTVLWAPVSKPFPYSILYFTDEYEDHGKALRKVVADFEDDYDIEKYSPTNYYRWITAPIQLHQGLNDDAVPFKWSEQLNETLKKNGVDIEYFEYPNADHNLMPGGWNTAVDRSLEFYNKNLLIIS